MKFIIPILFLSLTSYADSWIKPLPGSNDDLSNGFISYGFDCGSGCYRITKPMDMSIASIINVGDDDPDQPIMSSKQQTISCASFEDCQKRSESAIDIANSRLIPYCTSPAFEPLISKTSNGFELSCIKIIGYGKSNVKKIVVDPIKKSAKQSLLDAQKIQDAKLADARLSRMVRINGADLSKVTTLNDMKSIIQDVLDELKDRN